MKITYVGPFDEVEIAAVGVVCKHGGTVEVSEELGASLLEQTSNWQPVKATTMKKES